MNDIQFSVRYKGNDPLHINLEWTISINTVIEELKRRDTSIRYTVLHPIEEIYYKATQEQVMSFLSQLNSKDLVLWMDRIKGAKVYFK